MRTPAILATLVALAPWAVAQPDNKKGTGTRADPFVLTAEELAKESAAGAAKANKKYGGKFLRVTGTVGDVYDGLLYLPTQAKSPGGGTYKVGIGYPEGAKLGVKTGDTATFEGEFTLVGVLGPGLKDCKLVPPKKP